MPLHSYKSLEQYVDDRVTQYLAKLPELVNEALCCAAIVRGLGEQIRSLTIPVWRLCGQGCGYRADATVMLMLQRQDQIDWGNDWDVQVMVCENPEYLRIYVKHKIVQAANGVTSTEAK